MPIIFLCNISKSTHRVSLIDRHFNLNAPFHTVINTITKAVLVAFTNTTLNIQAQI